MIQKLSESLEDYLEAILELITVEGHAHVKEIAAKLHVKMPSVTNALKQLVEMGMIVYNTHYPVVLTPEGEKVARKVLHRHDVLKHFFADILGLEQKKASDTACHLEHVVDEETIDRFVLFSEAISGRTDAYSLRVYLTEAMDFSNRPGVFAVISDLKIGQTATVCGIGRNAASANPPLNSGDRLKVLALSLDKTQIRLDVNGQVIEIPVSLAENIWTKLVVCNI